MPGHQTQGCLYPIRVKMEGHPFDFAPWPGQDGQDRPPRPPACGAFLREFDSPYAFGSNENENFIYPHPSLRDSLPRLRGRAACALTRVGRGLFSREFDSPYAFGSNENENFIYPHPSLRDSLPRKRGRVGEGAIFKGGKLAQTC